MGGWGGGDEGGGDVAEEVNLVTGADGEAMGGESDAH